MKIMDLLGCGGSYTNLHAVHFGEDLLFMGQDGASHSGIADRRPSLLPAPDAMLPDRQGRS